MSIKEVLEHSWIQKFTKGKVSDMRRTSKDPGASNFLVYSSISEETKPDLNK